MNEQDKKKLTEILDGLRRSLDRDAAAGTVWSQTHLVAEWAEARLLEMVR